MIIPLLQASDIECRVQSVRQTYDKSGFEAIILLYKDARCDMKHLDNLFGITGWKRYHKLIGDRLYCTIEIWDAEKKEWISKEDVGTESNTEKEKGQASDSFKRAAVNVGIGRELYTAPSIKIALNEREWTKDNDKYKTYASFSVKDIEYDEDRQISKLVIVDRFGNERFSFPASKKSKKEAPTQSARDTLVSMLFTRGIDFKEYAKEHNLTKETPESVFKALISEIIESEKVDTSSGFADAPPEA